MKEILKNSIMLVAIAGLSLVMEGSFPPECPKDDNGFTIYIPDPDCCSQYYVCSNGTAVRKKCPKGLVWDDFTECCTFPDCVFGSYCTDFDCDEDDYGDEISSGGPEDCDILTYNRGRFPNRKTEYIFGAAGAYISFIWKGKTYGPIKIGVDGKLPIRVPVCEEDPNNCCIKTWVDEPVIYL
ncbi:MAG: carbohydrate-binding module family 14 protein [Dysgonamonadaceae bacterium]|jgi:hypothetical protein|nr:carbohydrate-binding module family 14 protein [Dysgonamonadaceae bacterium]